MGPDRRIAAVFVPVREFVRAWRRCWAKIICRNISFGDNCYFGKKALFLVPEKARFGSNVAMGAYLFVQANVEIGDDCLISSRVSFIGNDHCLEEDKSPYWSRCGPPSTIVLEGENFIGYGATILGNVRVGRGAIIGAHALVNADVPSEAVVAGVPARVIRMRRQMGEVSEVQQ